MAFSHGKEAVVYLQSMNATTVVTEVGESGDVDVAETSVLGTSSKTYIPGMNDAKVSITGNFDSDTTTDSNTFSYLIDSLRGTNPMQTTYLPSGDSTVTSGTTPCYLINGQISSYEIKTGTGDVASFKLDLQSSTGLQRAFVAHGLQARTATGNGTQIIDGGAASTTGAAAMLHITAVSGTSTPTLTVKIQGSADGSTAWTDITGLTFTAATAKGSQYLATTSTASIARYLRAIWTISGSSPSFTFFVGVARR